MVFLAVDRFCFTVLHGFRLSVVEEIDADVKVVRDLRDGDRVRNAESVFPFADGLRADVQSLRQLFLGETMVLPQSGDVLSEPDVLHGISSVFL